jgi:hypothetical protein
MVGTPPDAFASGGFVLLSQKAAGGEGENQLIGKIQV